MGNATIQQSGDGVAKVQQGGTDVGSGIDTINFQSGATVTPDPSNPRIARVVVSGGGGGGTGNVTGPVSSVVGNVASWNATDGTLLADGGVAVANVPSAGQKSALAGTSGTPGSGNKYVTDADARNTNARTPTAHAATHVTGGGDTIANAVASGNAGLMSGADKAKLDGIGAGANVTSVNTRTGAVVLDNTDVGLGNVTNDAQVKRSELGAPSGVAQLDANSRVAQDPSFLRGAQPSVTKTFSTGTSQPASIADATMTGFTAGGSTSPKAAGAVAFSFSSAATETGSGAGQAGLGANSPLTDSAYAGVRIRVELFKQNGDVLIVNDVLSAPPVADLESPVYGYLSFRSDLGANLKWRLWYYYIAQGTGVETAVTPTVSVTNVNVYVPAMYFAAEVPASADFNGTLLAGERAVENAPGSISTGMLANNAVTSAKASTATPGTAVQSDAASASAGSASSLMKSDAGLVVATATPGTTVKSEATSASQGSSTSVLRADAQIQAATAAPGTSVQSDATSSAQGSASTLVRSDARFVAATAAPGTTVKSEATAAGQGTSTSLLRADAQFQVATAVPGTQVLSDASTAAQGTSSSVLRADARLLATTAAPVAIDAAANAQGTSTSLARADHKHTVTTAAPVTVAQANSAGSATSLALSDHVHKAPPTIRLTGLTTTAMTGGAGQLGYFSGVETISPTDCATSGHGAGVCVYDGVSGEAIFAGLVTVQFTTAGGSPANGGGAWIAAATDDGSTAAGKATATAPSAASNQSREIGTVIDNSNYASAKTCVVALRPKLTIPLAAVPPVSAHFLKMSGGTPAEAEVNDLYAAQGWLGSTGQDGANATYNGAQTDPLPEFTTVTVTGNVTPNASLAKSTIIYAQTSITINDTFTVNSNGKGAGGGTAGAGGTAGGAGGTGGNSTTATYTTVVVINGASGGNGGTTGNPGSDGTAGTTGGTNQGANGAGGGGAGANSGGTTGGAGGTGGNSVANNLNWEAAKWTRAPEAASSGTAFQPGSGAGGGGGGGASTGGGSGSAGILGGAGGGGTFLSSPTVSCVNTGAIQANGATGGNAAAGTNGNGGGGSGAAGGGGGGGVAVCRLIAGTININAVGGSGGTQANGGTGTGGGFAGGKGGVPASGGPGVPITARLS